MLRKAPVYGDLSVEYWRACAEKVLTVQRCSSCGEHQFYPRYLCLSCQCTDLEWVESEGGGAVYSYTEIQAHPDPAVNERCPLIVALIDLDEGVRVMSNVVDVSINEMFIGCRVAVDWEETDSGYLPIFRKDHGNSI